jgi:hypothetical protein
VIESRKLSIRVLWGPSNCRKLEGNSGDVTYIENYQLADDVPLNKAIFWSYFKIVRGYPLAHGQTRHSLYPPWHLWNVLTWPQNCTPSHAMSLFSQLIIQKKDFYSVECQRYSIPELWLHGQGKSPSAPPPPVAATLENLRSGMRKVKSLRQRLADGSAPAGLTASYEEQTQLDV